MATSKPFPPYVQGKSSMASSKPYHSPSAKAADFFDANRNQMVGAVADVVLLREGHRWEVNKPWTGPELAAIEVKYSAWYKALMGRLRHLDTASYDSSAFVLIFPQDTTVEEAERCCEVYMTLLSLVRQEQHS